MLPAFTRLTKVGFQIERDLLDQYKQLAEMVLAVLELDVICALPLVQLFSPLVPFFAPSLALQMPRPSPSSSDPQQQKIKVSRMQLVLSVLVANEERGWELARSLRLVSPSFPSAPASAPRNEDEQTILNNFVRLLLERFRDERAFGLIARSQQPDKLGL